MEKINSFGDQKVGEKMSQEEVWNGIAEKWNQFRRVIFDNTIEFINKSEGKILDIGCGSGRNFMKKNNLEWYAVDFSPHMVALAEKKAKELNMKISLQKAQADQLPFENEYFDNILFVTVLHCIPESDKRKKSLQEAHRVLKRKGKMLLSVWGPKSPKIKGQMGNIQVPWTVDGKELIREQYIYTEKELKSLLESVGFKIISFEEGDNLTFVVERP